MARQELNNYMEKIRIGTFGMTVILSSSRLSLFFKSTTNDHDYESPCKLREDYWRSVFPATNQMPGRLHIQMFAAMSGYSKCSTLNAAGNDSFIQFSCSFVCPSQIYLFRRFQQVPHIPRVTLPRNQVVFT
jgi:hypothetical protein